MAMSAEEKKSNRLRRQIADLKSRQEAARGVSVGPGYTKRAAQIEALYKTLGGLLSSAGAVQKPGKAFTVHKVGSTGGGR
jgi:hypothetical protein